VCVYGVYSHQQNHATLKVQALHSTLITVEANPGQFFFVHGHRGSKAGGVGEDEVMARSRPRYAN